MITITYKLALFLPFCSLKILRVWYHPAQKKKWPDWRCNQCNIKVLPQMSYNQFYEQVQKFELPVHFIWCLWCKNVKINSAVNQLKDERVTLAVQCTFNSQLIFTVYMWSNFHTNTCNKIPALGRKCLLDRPDSLPTIQSQKGVESGDETISKP